MSDIYSNARHQVRQLLTVGDALGYDFNVTGTNASDVESFRFRIPRKITIDEASVVFMSAATVAAANLSILQLKKSTGGTTGGASFGTYQTIGTTVAGLGAALTVTATDFAAGDHLIVSVAAGTNATSGWLAQVLIGWKEDFPSTVDPSTGG